MPIDTLTALATFILASSLATERVVTIVKTLVPWLAEEKRTAANREDLRADRPRRIAVQAVAFLASWATAALIAASLATTFGAALLGSVAFAANHQLPTWVIGLLASGGSAFWNQVLGYTKAVKDARVQDRLLRAAAPKTGGPQ